MDESKTVLVTVEEAARILGIKEESVRKRVQRKKIPWEKDADDRLFVWVDSPGTVCGKSVKSEDLSGTELEEEMRARIADLKDQLDQEREARRRADTLIAQLSQANAELARTVRSIEAPASTEQPPDGPETASEPQGRGDVPDESETATERPWWRRMFGSKT